MLFFIFVSQYYGHHRDLHSFPTRRSSDLNFTNATLNITNSLQFENSATAGRQYDSDGNVSDGSITGGVLDRSEEHTSELQSRPHLVCRLLLEKKKTQECLSYNPLTTSKLP